MGYGVWCHVVHSTLRHAPCSSSGGGDRGGGGGVGTVSHYVEQTHAREVAVAVAVVVGGRSCGKFLDAYYCQ